MPAVRGEDLGFAAVRAAQEANLITQAANVVDRRPWLHAEVTSLEDYQVSTLAAHDLNGERKFTVTANIKIINSGKTPAQEVRILIRASSESVLNDEAEPAMMGQYAKGMETVGVVPPNGTLQLPFYVTRALDDLPEKLDFIFDTVILCVLTYTSRTPNSRGEKFRTTQVFSIEHSNGRRRTRNLETHEIRNQIGKLTARPIIGLMP